MVALTGSLSFSVVAAAVFGFVGSGLSFARSLVSAPLALVVSDFTGGLASATLSFVVADSPDLTIVVVAGADSSAFLTCGDEAFAGTDNVDCVDDTPGTGVTDLVDGLLPGVGVVTCAGNGEASAGTISL